MKTKAAALAVLTLLLAQPAAAQTPDGGISMEDFVAGGKDEFFRMDLNGDGVVDEVEFEEFMRRDFTALDLDGNGVLTEDEIDALGRSGGDPDAARALLDAR